MRILTTRAAFVVALASGLLVPPLASAASCEWSLRLAAEVANHGERASTSGNELEARRFARDARLSAVDGAREAQACGCAAAMPSFEDASLQANYADRAQNLTSAQQYGRRIKSLGEKAQDALHRCPAG